MISSDTPYKLAEIIRDTWPNLFRPPFKPLDNPPPPQYNSRTTK